MNWSLDGVNELPECTLDAWSAFEAPFDGLVLPWTVHLTGFRRESGRGRVSSPVECFDPVTRRARTRTGRVYELSGNPGMNPDALAAWGLWKRKNHIAHELDVTDEVEDLLDRAGDWSIAPCSTDGSPAGMVPKTPRATLEEASEWHLHVELTFYRDLLHKMHRFALATMSKEPAWSLEQVLGHVEVHLIASGLELHALEAEWLLKELRKALSS